MLSPQYCEVAYVHLKVFYAVTLCPSAGFSASLCVCFLHEGWLLSVPDWQALRFVALCFHSPVFF